MVWMKVPLSEIEVEGIDRAKFDATYGVNMQVWRPVVPEGETHFKLAKLTFDGSGNMGCNVSLLTAEGAPVASCAVAQGWWDGAKLPADSIPQGGDPREYPNKGHVFFTNALGVVLFTWGPGEAFNPMTEEGPHWYWVPMGPAGLWSDVVYGFGWKGDTNHHKMQPHFVRVVGGDDGEPEPPGCNIFARIAAAWKALFG